MFLFQIIAGGESRHPFYKLMQQDDTQNFPFSNQDGNILHVVSQRCRYCNCSPCFTKTNEEFKNAVSLFQNEAIQILSIFKLKVWGNPGRKMQSHMSPCQATSFSRCI